MLNEVVNYRSLPNECSPQQLAYIMPVQCVILDNVVIMLGT